MKGVRSLKIYIFISGLDVEITSNNHTNLTTINN